MQDSYDAYLHTNCLIAHGLKTFAALQRNFQSSGMSLQVTGRAVRDVSCLLHSSSATTTSNPPQFFRALNTHFKLRLSPVGKEARWGYLRRKCWRKCLDKSGGGNRGTKKMSWWGTCFLIRTFHQSVYYLGGHSRRIGWTGYVVHLERWVMLESFRQKTWREGTTSDRRKWENNIKLDRKRMGCEGMNFIWHCVASIGCILWMRWWIFGFLKS